MKEEIAKRWIEELRSGRHQQAREEMCNAEGEMCCLGVLQIVVLELPLLANCWLEPQAMEASGVETPVANIPFLVKNQASLVALNDTGTSFSEIADIIEKLWPDL